MSCEIRPLNLRTSSFLLSTFRIVTMVRNAGHSNVEDDRKNAKGLKSFQISPSKGMNVAIEGMGHPKQI